MRRKVKVEVESSRGKAGLGGSGDQQTGGRWRLSGQRSCKGRCTINNIVNNSKTLIIAVSYIWMYTVSYTVSYTELYMCERIYGNMQV